MKPSLQSRRKFVHRVASLSATRVFAQETPPWQPMFDGKTLKGWRETPFTGHGAVSVADGSITLGKGTLTGIHWAGAFPSVDYEIRFEALRVDGHDFFAGLTFPVHDSFCSWINGGWGGRVVGLSSIDGYDASENDTTFARDFDSGRWYGFWLLVTWQRIQAWIDEEPVIDISTANRQIGLRPGEIELSRPLGFAAYSTTAKLRKIEYRNLGQAG
jgi:hypothetical protein